MTTTEVYTTGLRDMERQMIELLLPGPKRLGCKIEIWQICTREGEL